MNTTDEIKKPAIGLLVGGIILGIIALVNLLMTGDIVGRLGDLNGHPEIVTLMRALNYILGLVMLVMSVFAILGARSMMKGCGYGMARTGAICLIVGAVLSLCPGWILVLPMGIWAFVVLRRPAVKTFFKQDSTHLQPPS